ncbi:MAG: hypothetical protein FJ098_07445, partial [Deltaproteobacteria bacterium]|nr:hypothetical protein [Deltaproteobacteria bacterium]
MIYRIAPFLVVLSLLSRPAAAGETPVHDPLWQKALAVAAANRAWRPRRVLEDERLLNPRGGLDRETKGVHEVFRDDEGRWRARLVSATRGGRTSRRSAGPSWRSGPHRSSSGPSTTSSPPSGTRPTPRSARTSGTTSRGGPRWAS